MTSHRSTGILCMGMSVSILAQAVAPRGCVCDRRARDGSRESGATCGREPHIASLEELQQVVRDALNPQSLSEEQLRALHDQNQVHQQTVVSQIPALVEAMLTFIDPFSRLLAVRDRVHQESLAAAVRRASSSGSCASWT